MMWLFGLILYIQCIVQLSEANSPERTCLDRKAGSKLPRYVNYRGETLQIVLGVSDRVTHQLVTNIFSIFLHEVLDYSMVNVHSYKETNLTSVLDDLSDHQKIFPTYSINTEVWVPPNESPITEIYNIHECGSVGLTGRYGWFIPSNFLNNSHFAGSDSWRFFQNSDKAKYFAQESILKKIDSKRNKFSCNGTFCNSSYYEPPRCKSNKCALLLSDHRDQTGFVITQIEKLGLYVSVVWLGFGLEDTVLALLKEKQPFVFVAFTPSEIVLPSDPSFYTVVFPPCENLHNQGIPCHYDTQRLVKLAWAELASNARPAYSALQKMQFRPEDYTEMLMKYRKTKRNNEEPDLWDIACTWMRSHQAVKRDHTTWYYWEQDREDRNVLVIGGIFPLKNNLHSSSGIVIGASMAKDAVTFDENILRDYQINFLLHDGQCRGDIVLKTFIDYIFMDHYKNLIGILGPACSDTVEPLAGVAKHFKTVIISYSAEGSSFSNREKYPYFFRTIGENQQFKYVYLDMFRFFKWERVASLTEDGTKYTEYISHMQDLFHAHGINFTANRKFPQDWEPKLMHQYLEELIGMNARIIIADVKEDVARAVMCEAYKLGMTAANGYVWFLPHWFSSDWYNVSFRSPSRTKISDCSTAQMVEAINGYLSLSHAYFGEPDSIMQENITVREWQEKYSKKCKNSNTTESHYAGYAYDAYWTYAYALDKLLKENQSYISDIHSMAATKRFVEIIQSTDFVGVSGRVFFGNGSSRYSSVNIIQWLNATAEVKATYDPNITEKGFEGGRLIWTSNIKWLTPNGEVPKDGKIEPPRCLVQSFADFLGADCEATVILLNVFAFAVLGICVCTSFILFKRRYDKSMHETEIFMKSLGIDLLKPLGALDTWEIPRDRVVINRKLGEGAFGTVYGGEAHLNEKGWVAVAVKTLKVGSTTEEKLDFLSEAEVMKRFEHKNIVKLLGVCTKNEPVYTIMEFMLYGDLKTFLLARRHLVNEKQSEESDEVSSKKLTSMALDVARALSYLAELKYVHRDVASRNCLVNANRVVKLGDFGMTRLMFENEYYKFNRKGMLPVRWMAPESLALGVFTPASDVWSYGVLLYEIITFGSFPFQGLSNNQVLDHVKAGNTITIPAGVKPQLDWLIKSCWNQDYKKRPQASEIVEYVANNPRLLSPCLDVPLSSVQMEDTGQLEIQIPLSSRFSIPSTIRQRRSSDESETEDPVPATRPWVDVSDDTLDRPLLPSPSNLITLQPARQNSNQNQDYSDNQDSIL